MASAIRFSRQLAHFLCVVLGLVAAPAHAISWSDLSRVEKALLSEEAPVPHVTRPESLEHALAARWMNQAVSWLVLLDAGRGNVLRSPGLRDYYETSPACFRRLLLELLERELSRLSEGSRAHEVIGTIYHRFMTASLPEMPTAVLERTESYELRRSRNFAVEIGSPRLTREWSWLRSLLRRNPAPPRAEIEAALHEARGCARPLSPGELFGWMDWATLEDLLQSSEPKEVVAAKLIQFSESADSLIPRIAPHFEVTMALHPRLGFYPSGEDFSLAFTRAFLDLIPKRAFGKEEALDRLKCQKVQPLLLLASLAGFSIDRFTWSKLGVTGEEFKEWMLFQASAYIAVSRGIQDCVPMLRLIENIWPEATGFPPTYEPSILMNYYFEDILTISHPEPQFEIQVRLNRKPAKDGGTRKAGLESALKSSITPRVPVIADVTQPWRKELPPYR